MESYQEKMKIIQQFIENEEYKKAVQALIMLIEMLNVKNIYENYHIKEKKLNLYDIMEIYRQSDEVRYDIMMDINYVYEQITNKEIVAKDCAIILKQKCEELIRC